MGDEKIRELNRDFRKTNRPTDVLAFCQDKTARGNNLPVLLGDVAISVDQARYQAESLGHSFKEELAILLSHGILHLLGYEDYKAKSKKKMFKKQDELLKVLKRKKLI